jgi:hypothetical protein
MSLIAASSGWVIGWVIFLVVVLLVVALLSLMIKGARDAAIKAESIVEAFKESEVNTDGLWNVDTVNHHIVDITSSARAAREYLESAGGES